MTTRRSSRLGGEGVEKMTTARRSSRLGGEGVESSSLSSPKKKKLTTSTAFSISAGDENAPNLPASRTTRRTVDAAAEAKAREEEEENKIKKAKMTTEDHEEDDDDDDAEIYVFNGVTYATYQEMVDAKRLRNQQVLVASGLLQAAPKSSLSSSGLNKKKRRSSTTTTSSNSNSKSNDINERRKSKRLAGIVSDGTFIEDERGGRFSIASSSDAALLDGSIITTTDLNIAAANESSNRRSRRINDGSDLSLEQAVQLIGPKWLEEDSVAQVQRLMRDTILPQPNRDASSVSSSPSKNYGNKTKEQEEGHDRSAWASLQQVQARSMDQDNINVAKVVPDRIYSITTHPSARQLVVCAGDKQGYIGMWNVDAGLSLSSSSGNMEPACSNTTRGDETDGGGENKNSPTSTVTPSALETSDSNIKNNSNHDGIYLFRPHASTPACLEWTRQGTALLSTSYDGTCRLFDVAAERFQQVFDSSSLANGLDLHESESDYYNDSDYWFQYACLDHRNQDCFFLSTSVGTAMHVDMRASGKQRVTFHEEWSEKKINTLSLHPNGYSLLSAGLDTKARLWDLRLLSNRRGNSSSRKRSGVQPVAFYEAGRSISSAFFSPSGRFVVSTTMMDRLDILQDIHTAATTTSSSKNNGAILVQPVQSIRHNNKTGRWLSTFMAQWHAVHDVFCVGSMEQPRVMEVFLDPSNSNKKNSGAHDPFGRVAFGGDAMTAVTSRCCFHPRSDQLIVVGGTSSGRVAISR